MFSCVWHAVSSVFDVRVRAFFLSPCFSPRVVCDVLCDVLCVVSAVSVTVRVAAEPFLCQAVLGCDDAHLCLCRWRVASVAQLLALLLTCCRRVQLRARPLSDAFFQRMPEDTVDQQGKPCALLREALGQC